MTALRNPLTTPLNLILGLALSLSLLTSPVFAQDTVDVIDVNIGINVCGNELVEAPAEDCEDDDLNSASCTTLGYSGGTLSCDQACTFDVSACLASTPTPTPAGAGTGAAASSAPAATLSTPTPTPTETPELPVITNLLTVLPGTIRNLLEESGLSAALTLTTQEIAAVVQTWVDSWHELALPTLTSDPSAPIVSPDPAEIARCDINKDRTCNLTDLSVILFYVNR